MQDCSNSSALAMELLQSCTQPLICCVVCHSGEGSEIPVLSAMGDISHDIWHNKRQDVYMSDMEHDDSGPGGCTDVISTNK